MAGPGTETKKISLKILVDTKSNQIVFAEAGKDFVDFIIELMTLPLSTVSKLLNERNHNMGCLGSISKSIESLDTQYYESSSSKNTALNPSAFISVPLLSLNDAPSNLILYKCGRRHINYYSDRKGAVCPSCNPVTLSNEYKFEQYVPPRTSGSSSDAGYVKEAVTYIVMDNLEFKPMSYSLITSLVKDFDSLKEREVKVGRDQGLALLKASLERQDVLTSVFLREKN